MLDEWHRIDDEFYAKSVSYKRKAYTLIVAMLVTLLAAVFTLFLVGLLPAALLLGATFCIDIAGIRVCEQWREHIAAWRLHISRL